MRKTEAIHYLKSAIEALEIEDEKNLPSLATLTVGQLMDQLEKLDPTNVITLHYNGEDISLGGAGVGYDGNLKIFAHTVESSKWWKI